MVYSIRHRVNVALRARIRWLNNMKMICTRDTIECRRSQLNCTRAMPSDSIIADSIWCMTAVQILCGWRVRCCSIFFETYVAQ